MLLRQFDSVGVFLVALVLFGKNLSSHFACFSATNISPDAGLWPRKNSSPQLSHLRVPISWNRQFSLGYSSLSPLPSSVLSLGR
jgi:hypothetical protein